MSTALTTTERSRLTALEATVTTGLQSFFEVGQALKEIRDGKLYRAEHGTFEDYCDKRWEISRDFAYKKIAASDVRSDLSTIVDILPSNEAQCRPLTRLPDCDRQTAWQTVLERAPETEDGVKIITAKLVQDVVDEFSSKTPHVRHNSGETDELPDLEKIIRDHYPEFTGVHPACLAVPMCTDDEFKRLVESIKENGLREAIIRTKDGLLLDGKVRLIACYVAHQDIRVVDDAGLIDPWIVVTEKNFARKHLTDGQKESFGHELRSHFAAKPATEADA